MISIIYIYVLLIDVHPLYMWLQVTVEEQLEAHERRLADRISALEASSSTSGKAKAKKK